MTRFGRMRGGVATSKERLLATPPRGPNSVADGHFQRPANEYHPLPIIKFGSQSAICGKANKIIKATISAERKGTTPL